MRTFGMWLLAGLFMLAGWDAVERLDRREERSQSSAPATQQDSGTAQATEDGTPPPPRYSY
jgi:hypothetical protein